jgi:phosphoribosylpyrophosphate synthetase
MEETATNIYLEPPFAIGHVGLALQQQQGLVYISGDTAGTKRATLLAKKLAEQKVMNATKKRCQAQPRQYEGSENLLLLTHINQIFCNSVAQLFVSQGIIIRSAQSRLDLTSPTGQVEETPSGQW